MPTNERQRIAIIIAIVIVAVVGSVFGFHPDAEDQTNHDLFTTIADIQKRIDTADARISDLEKIVRNIDTKPKKIEQPKQDPKTTKQVAATGDVKKDRVRCTATAKSTGKQCKCMAIDGTDKCEWHND